MRFPSFAKNILTGFFLVGALSACGPSGATNGSNRKIFFDTSNTGGAAVTTGCHTPQSPNIVPIQDTTLDGSRHYATCFDPADPGKVRVMGHSTRSDWLCAYPIAITGPTTFVAIKDVNGIPVSQCWSASAAGASGQNLNYYFSGFNGLIVVEFEQRTDMNRCLTTGQTCPNDFSVGEL